MLIIEKLQRKVLVVRPLREGGEMREQYCKYSLLVKGLKLWFKTNIFRSLLELHSEHSPAYGQRSFLLDKQGGRSYLSNMIMVITLLCMQIVIYNNNKLVLTKLHFILIYRLIKVRFVSKINYVSLFYVLCFINRKRPFQESCSHLGEPSKKSYILCGGNVR